MFMAVKWPPALLPDAATGLGAVLAFGGAGATGGGATGVELAAGGAAFADSVALRTKLKVVPGGKTTRAPVATAATLGGTFLGLPKLLKTELAAFATLPTAFCAVLVTLAELLVTATACPLITTEESCATQTDPLLASVTVAAAPCVIVTPLPALTGWVTELR